MRMAGDLDVVKTAASMPGLMGVELQATAGKKHLRDWDVVRGSERRIAGGCTFRRWPASSTRA